MDWKNWCGLCGSLDPILKLDEDQKRVVTKIIDELNHEDFKVCLECVTFLNTCSDFINKTRQIQLMFEEAKYCKDINSLRENYGLQPALLVTTEEVSSIQLIISNETEVLYEEDFDDFIKEEHLNDDDEDEIDELPRDGLKCEECNLSYKTRKAFDKHMINKHGTNSIKFICSICGRSFKEKQILKNHEKIHLPDEEKLKFPCSFCHKKFINNHCLKIHVARIHEKKSYFFCEVCGKGSTTKSDLVWHMDKHTQERNFSCDICSQKFKSTNSLRNHKRRHEAIEATKQCSICKKEFRSNTALNNHKLVHSNEKRYRCQYCPNSYKRLETYKNHISNHTGIRPFKCQWCTRTFVNAANCRKHKLKDHPKEVEEYEAIHGKRGVSLAFKQQIK